MSKILTADLHNIDLETFVNDVNPVQAKTLLGGGYYYINMNNITDSVAINSSGSNTVEAGGIHSISYHDNTFNSIDNSASVFNMFYNY